MGYTIVAALFVAAGLLLIGIPASGGGDSGAAAGIGAAVLAVGLALVIYAGWQWVRYAANKARG